MDTNYPMRIYADKSSDPVYWVVEYPDLPGCIGVGDTPEEALAEGEIHKRMWLDAAKELNQEFPEPNNIYASEYSGKFNVRIAKTLHRDLAIRAEAEGISLNSLVQTILANGVRKNFNPVAEMKVDVKTEDLNVKYQASNFNPSGWVPQSKGLCIFDSSKRAG